MTAIQYLEQKQREQYGSTLRDPQEEQLKKHIQLIQHLDDPKYPMSDKEKEENIKEFIEDMNSCPSKYQNVLEYRIMRDLFFSLKEVIDSGMVTSADGLKIEWKDLPVFGTLKMNDFSAYITLVNNVSDPLIVFSDTVLNFASLISKAISLSFPVKKEKNGGVSYSTDIKKIKQLLETQKEGIARFVDLMTAYSMYGRSKMAEAYYIDRKYIPLVDTFCIAFETFIIAHEYSHFVHEDLGSPTLDMDELNTTEAEDELVSRYSQELNADVLGATLTLAKMNMAGYDKTLSASGVYLCLRSLELINRVKNILRGRDEDYYYSDTHPWPDFRIKMFLDKVVGNDIACLDYFKTIDFLIDIYWQEFRKTFDSLLKLFDKIDKNFQTIDYGMVSKLIYRAYSIK